jgi:uncharacterized protein YjbJ (UPF0337 family)
MPLYFGEPYMLTLKNFRQTLKRVLSLSLAVCAIASSILFSFPTQATAMNDAGRVVKERAKTELDSKTSTGVGDEVEGRIKKNAGKVQRQFGDSTKGTARQMEGQAQENAAKARRGAENLAEDAQEKADGIVDSIKNFFD